MDRKMSLSAYRRTLTLVERLPQPENRMLTRRHTAATVSRGEGDCE